MIGHPRVSVVINTYNRGYHLKRVLDALTRQTYDNFEVVVVNGPSTDNTEIVLSKYHGAIKIATCPVVNLCVSRNIGINTCAGEIVAFIDDDAVPGHRHWIENAVKAFEDPDIGALGGEVRQFNEELQFLNGYYSIWGENKNINLVSQYFDIRHDEKFNGVMGCNCFFRKKILKKVGGFDEYYVYFLDETDLCYRIIQSGYKVIHSKDILVYHEAAGGSNRKSKYHLNYEIIFRSIGYFVMKTTGDFDYPERERKERALQFLTNQRKDFKWLLNHNEIDKCTYRDFCAQTEKGITDGIRDGLSANRMLDLNIADENDNFVAFSKDITADQMSICFLCYDNIIKPIGGIAVYTHDLARGLSQCGHNVHVICCGDSDEMTNVEGININYIRPHELDIEELYVCPNSQRIVEFSYESFKKIQQIKRIYSLNIIESPIWDVHGLVSVYLDQSVPVVTRLETPLKMFVKTFELPMDEGLQIRIMMEEELLKRSRAIIAISKCIHNTIEEEYQLKLRQHVYYNYLGINTKTAVRQRSRDDGRTIAYFVGRLERRKGIKNILEIAPDLLQKYPNFEIHLAGDDTIVDKILGDTFKNVFLQKYKNARWLKRLKFMGKISEEQKNQEFADCDFFLSPSLYESFGIIFLEAMKYGKAVIGCRAGGMEEVVEDKVTGLLCYPNNSKDLQACMEQLINDIPLRDRMGEAGLKRFSERFTENIMCDECEKIYRQVMQSF